MRTNVLEVENLIRNYRSIIVFNKSYIRYFFNSYVALLIII